MLCVPGSKRPSTRTIVFCGIACLGWLLAVNLSYCLRVCDRCDTRELVSRINILGFTVWERILTKVSPVQHLAVALGCPCHHPRAQEELLVKYWGFLLEQGEIGDYFFPSDGGSVVEFDSRAIQQLALEQPDISRQYEERVLEHKDYGFYRQILDKVRASADVRMKATVPAQRVPHEGTAEK